MFPEQEATSERLINIQGHWAKNYTGFECNLNFQAYIPYTIPKGDAEYREDIIVIRLTVLPLWAQMSQ